MGIAVNSHRSIAQHTRSIVNMKLLSSPLPWPLWPPPRPTMATTAMAVMVVTAMVDTARGPLMPSPLLRLRPSPRLRLPQLPTTVPDTAMAVMALAPMAAMVAFTDSARGPLMPMPTTVPDTAMAAMAVTAVAFTDTARGLLMPMPTTAMAVM